MSVKLEYDRNDPAWLHEPDNEYWNNMVDDEMYIDDQVEPKEGVPFFADGEDYVWLEPESDVYHMDFDNWQVWSATDGVGTDYFVVDIDTGFIDCGPCSEKEAKEFLESKYNDYLDEAEDTDPERTDDILTEDEREFANEIDGICDYCEIIGDGSKIYPVCYNDPEDCENANDGMFYAYVRANSKDKANEIIDQEFNGHYFAGDEVKKVSESFDIDNSKIPEEEYNIRMIMWYFGTNYKDASDGIKSGFYDDNDIKKAKDYYNKKQNPTLEAYDGSYGEGSIEYPVFIASAEVGMSDNDFDAVAYIHADSEDEANDLLNKYFPSTRGTKYYLGDPSDDSFGIEDIVDEDTVKKSNGKWTNRGDDGKEHGEFATKKAADAQRKAMFANGYKGEDTGCSLNNKFKDESNLTEKRNFYVDVKDESGIYYDSFWVTCDRINQCQREINDMIGSNYKVSAIYDEDDNLLWPKRRRESVVNESNDDNEYTVIVSRNGKDKEVTGTLSYLINHFGYTLDKGCSWQNEKGNKKINRNPKTIKSLITNLNNAEDNATVNGNSNTSYRLKECTNTGSIPNVAAKHFRIMKDLDKTEESVVTERMDRDTKAFYDKMKDLNKYTGIVLKNIENDGEIKAELMTAAIVKIDGLLSAMTQIRDVSD